MLRNNRYIIIYTAVDGNLSPEHPAPSLIQMGRDYMWVCLYTIIAWLVLKITFKFNINVSIIFFNKRNFECLKKKILGYFVFRALFPRVFFLRGIFLSGIFVPRSFFSRGISSWILNNHQYIVCRAVCASEKKKKKTLKKLHRLPRKKYVSNAIKPKTSVVRKIHYSCR